MKNYFPNHELSLNGGNLTILDYLKFMDTRRCAVYDVYEAEKRDKRAKCVKANGNGTLYLAKSITDTLMLISPPAAGHKPEVPGNCAIILFYTRFCPGCHALVPHWNSLARNFVDIKVGALDALEYVNLINH